MPAVPALIPGVTVETVPVGDLIEHPANPRRGNVDAIVASIRQDGWHGVVVRLVAKYAQACNLFPSPDLEHKLTVLRGHCEDVGRDYDELWVILSQERASGLPDLRSLVTRGEDDGQARPTCGRRAWRLGFEPDV